MIRFVKHQDIDPARWDETIRQSRFPSVFCSYEMLDILTGDDTWHALILDDYAYIMPLPERSKFGIHYVYSPFFVSQLGIFSAKETSAQIVSDFFNAIPKTVKHIDLLLNTTNDHAFIGQFTTAMVSHQLDLSHDYQDLSTGFSQNTKRNIKAAQKHNLILHHDECNVEDIIHLFSTNRGKKKEVHFKPKDYEILTAAACQLKKLNRLQIYSVCTDDGQTIANAMFVRDYDRYWFWFSGRDTQYADSKPMFFLLDKFIEEHAGEHSILDFNGSMNENVARLYKGFGGQPYEIRMINYSKQIHWQLLLKLYHLIKG